MHLCMCWSSIAWPCSSSSSSGNICSLHMGKRPHSIITPQAPGQQMIPFSMTSQIDKLLVLVPICRSACQQALANCDACHPTWP